MVVIAILATLAAISSVALYQYLGVGEEAKCRSNMEQLAQLGVRYAEDHRLTLPTSGMADDEDTPFIDESEGWWLSVAPLVRGSVVFPQKAGDKMKVSSIFHCGSDARSMVDESATTFLADCKSVSYVSWTDGSEDPENPNSGIRKTGKTNYDKLPWLSDGNPVAGVSVTDAATFAKQVMPAAERHSGKIFMVMASGVVKAVELQEDADAGAMFRKLAPTLAAKAASAKSGAEAPASSSDDEEGGYDLSDDDESEDEESSADEDNTDDEE